MAIEKEEKAISVENEINRLKTLKTELTARQAAAVTSGDIPFAVTSGDIPQIKEHNVNINPEIIANIKETIANDIKSRTK